MLKTGVLLKMFVETGDYFCLSEFIDHIKNNIYLKLNFDTFLTKLSDRYSIYLF